MSQKMKLILSVALVLLLLLPAIPASAAVSLWEPVGSSGFSAGGVMWTSLAFSGSTPYVAFRDVGHENKATVMKYDGTSWVNVGSPGFSDGGADFIKLVFNGSTPYVAFSDISSAGRGVVMKYDGSAWVKVGASFCSAGRADYISLAFNGSVPYVAYMDLGHDNKATVMKYEGSSWVYVGPSAGISAGDVTFTSLAFDGSTPYVAFSNVGGTNPVSVMKYEASNWVNVGTAGTVGNGNYTALVISGGTPYVVFRANSDGKATVMRFNNNSSAWEVVGSAGFSANAVSLPSLAFSGGNPWVAYTDGTSHKTTVMRFTGTAWEVVGSAGFSTGDAYYASLAFSGDIPYVSYQDVGSSAKATVMRFVTHYYGSIAIRAAPGAVYQVRQGSTVVRDDVTVPAGGAITVSDLPLGTYSVVEKAPPSGCAADPTPQQAALLSDGQAVTLTFTSYPPVTIKTSKSDATVFGGTDGQIVVTAVGGAGTYEYSIGGTWQSGNTFNGLTGGIYSVKARDRVHPSNASAAATVVITQPGINGTFVLSAFPSRVWKNTAYQIALPAGYTNPVFTSGNSKVAKVSSSGLVHFISYGKVKLTMKATLNGKTKTVYKTVTVNTAVKSITLSYTNISLAKGKFTAKILPSDAGNKKLAWSSSNPKIASVSQKGVITPRSPGKVTITAMAKDGSGVKATFVLNIVYSVQVPST